MDCSIIIKHQHLHTSKLLMMQSFHIRDYVGAVQKANLLLLKFEIIEMAAPQCMHRTHALLQQLHELLAAGHGIAIHCRYASHACILLHHQAVFELV